MITRKKWSRDHRRLTIVAPDRSIHIHASMGTTPTNMEFVGAIVVEDEAIKEPVTIVPEIALDATMMSLHLDVYNLDDLHALYSLSRAKMIQRRKQLKNPS